MTIDHTLLPSTLYDYNVYGSDDVLAGTGEEVTLPDFEALSSTLTGGGIWCDALKLENEPRGCM